MAALKTLVVKAPDTIRNDILRTIKNGLIRQGVDDPNVGPTSDFYVTSEGLANELAVIGANGIVATDAQMPDTAQDADLTRTTGIFKLSPQPAAGSVGSVVIEASATSPIATDTELTDELGNRFKVTVGNNYANGASVPVAAISVGSATNHDEGDVLTWSSAPPFCSDKVTVAVGGLINGTDADDNESLRARLFDKFQVPPGSANPAQVAEALEASVGSVQKGFVYPAAQGPSSCEGVAVAAPTATNKSRQIASALMTGTVVPYVQGVLPRFGELNITTVDDTDVDVAIALVLPEASTANPPGPGGGWLNGSPWPAPNTLPNGKCSVTAVTDTKNFTVDAETPPVAFVSRVAWLSPYDWTLYTAVVTNFSGSTGAYVITIDKPFVGITTGCYIFPEAQNTQAYVDTLLAAFALMGPGEKTANAAVLSRGFRHPPPSSSWPYSLGPHLLHAITEAHEEVAAAQFYYRTDGTTTVTGSSGQVLPQPPSALGDPPLIYVPKMIGFYRLAA